MSLLKIIPSRVLLRTKLQYKFDCFPRWLRHSHSLTSNNNQSSYLSICTIRSLPYCFTRYCDTHPLWHRIMVHMPNHYDVHQLSSSRKPLSFTDDLLQKHIAQIFAEWNQIQKHLTGDQSDTRQPSVQQVSKRLHILEPIVAMVKQHEQCSADISELEDIISTSADKDAEVCETAENEIADLKMQLMALEDDIIRMLLPPLVGDDSDIILEVNAGVGGQEAMLFTKEVFDMYINYALYKGWSTNIVSYDVTDLGGLRHGVATVSGQNVFLQMKFEGGVHRVQRIPKTERGGRMHTSTVTVAILPQPSEIDIVLNPKDLRVETCRASGKGGQHVNKSETAVRIVHLPTGIAAECQAERSQIQNKEIAMTVLRSRLYEKEFDKSQQQQSSTRKLQVGSSGRSEKIRTYNMRDDRVTDHRINENVYGVNRLLEGGKELDELVDMVQLEARYERLIEQLQDAKTSSVADSTSS